MNLLKNQKQEKRKLRIGKMFDELTQVDIKKIQEEIDYRTGVVRTQIHEDIVAAKEFGDLSENAEYKEARRAKGQNESRITYLQNMLLFYHKPNDFDKKQKTYKLQSFVPVSEHILV